MNSFKDANNVTWDIDINVGAIKSLRSVGIDIISHDNKGIIGLSDDPVMLCDALWCLCRKQAESRSISEEKFFEAFHGDCMIEATTALMNAIADFFPEARRQVMKRAIEISLEADRAMMESVEKKLNEMDLQSVMSSPELSELTQND